MRYTNIDRNLELFVVTGIRTVILSMDFKEKPNNFMGFAFERKDHKTGNRTWLEGQKCFKKIIPDPVKGQKYPSFLHPVQSFMWKDFTVLPNREYTYKVTPVFGDPEHIQYGTAQSITVFTEKESFKDHAVYFNSGVSGSQYYSRQFNNIRPDEMNESDRKRALEWLSRGLFEAFIDFIEDTRNGQKLRGAFYEFKHKESLLALKAAHERGVDVEIVYSGKSYSEENEEMIRSLGLDNLVTYKRDNQVTQPHNKFLLKCGINDNPLRVWTGSTNLSEKAFYGHCNTGHIIKDKNIARKYYQYWKKLAENPDRNELRSLNASLQPDLENSEVPPGTTVFFSPRQNLDMLDEFAGIIKEAKNMVCCIYPFNIDDRFEEVFQIDKPFLRYILRDKATSNNTFETNDKDVELVTGAYVKSAIDQWLKETSAGGLIHGGVNYLHNKIILIDCLGENPVVISGSANYSKNSIKYNDENILTIKGNYNIADIYFTEFVRLFDHFSFREWLNKNEEDFKPFLKETGSWVNKYFDSPEFRSYKRKMSFKNMFIPNS